MQRSQISNIYKAKIQAPFFMTVAFLIAVFCFASSVYALTISPARIEIAGDPGATVGGEVTLINEQSTPQTFYVSYQNFTAQGETGTPAFTEEKTGLDTWMSMPEPQITIPAGKAIQVPYTIHIPNDAEPGGYFAAIFWSTTPPVSVTGQVSIGAKIGMLILLSVNGNVKESAGITSFSRTGHGFFYNTLPVALTYKFRNDGGDRVEPTGFVTIRDAVFIRSAKLDANTVNGNILPNSTRGFDVVWVNKKFDTTPPHGFLNTVAYQWHNFAVGLYSAHLKLIYGTQQLETHKTVWFFVFPWQLLVCMFVVLFIAWWGGTRLLRRYNRHIIARARAAILSANEESSR